MTQADYKLAIELLADRKFLFHVSEQIGEYGITGEEKNRMAVFLACLTTQMKFPVSVVLKGPSGGGKSNLLRGVLRLIPPTMIEERSSFSEMALVYSNVDLRNKILYLHELKGGDATRLTLRLLQSEGSVTREVTRVRGRTRDTEVVRYVGSPVILTSTTQDTIFEDDETRFLSLRIDDSEAQTRAILRCSLASKTQPEVASTEGFRLAVQLLSQKARNFEFDPFMRTIVERGNPLVRRRRDFPKVLSLCSAVALAMAPSEKQVKTPAIKVKFSHYVMLYRVLQSAFTEPPRQCSASTFAVVEAVDVLSREKHAAVPSISIMKHLGWSRGAIYKHISRALEAEMIVAEAGPRRNNEQRYAPAKTGDHFLLSPRKLIDAHSELRGCRFLDPITGTQMLAADIE